MKLVENKISLVRDLEQTILVFALLSGWLICWVMVVTGARIIGRKELIEENPAEIAALQRRGNRLQVFLEKWILKSQTRLVEITKALGI